MLTQAAEIFKIALRHISNHSSKSRYINVILFETKLCQRHYLSHNSMKNSYFGDMLMSIKTLSIISKSPFYVELILLRQNYV